MPAPVKSTPEQLLSQLQEEERNAVWGRLKIFLGYASGVGKSFRMLDEGRRRRERGQDVVIGATQPGYSPELQDLLNQLETIPLGESGGTAFMDVGRILRRHPQVCLVDGLAYDNPLGSTHPHRWQDVRELLDAGISVLGTINLQFVAERQREVEQIRGRSVSVSVPEAFLRKAYDIVVVDAPAELCTAKEDKAISTALSRAEQHKLSQLREIALLLAADVVDGQLEAYLERQGVAQSWGTQERLLVCLNANTNAARMLERASLARERFHGELFAVYVGKLRLTGEEQQALERNLDLAKRAGADIRLLDGEDEVKTIIDFARREGITQIFIGHSLTDDWRARFTRTTADRLIRAAEDIDIKLFPN